MKKDFYDESFEGFLKKNADQLRMRPSENVWKNIEKRGNRHRRRIAFTSALFLLTASLFGYFSWNHQPTGTMKPVAQSPLQQDAASQPLQDHRQGTQNNNPLRPVHVTTTGSTLTAQKPVASLRVAFNSGNKPPAIQPDEKTGEPVPSFDIIPSDTYDPTPAGEPLAAAATASEREEYPLSIESVVNLYKAGRKKKKAEFQLFFTPTISYRKLSENKSYLRAMPQGSSTPNYAAFYDVNNVVTHKPDLGLELGFSVKYPLTQAIKLKTGLQFNMNRYDIKVFNNLPEIATISLNGGTGRVNSLNTVTRYRNFSGAQSDWVQNTYYQISSPVGVEVKLRGDDQKQFGIATNIQPTYIIGDRAYLISTDYKNYSQVPWLIRNWNVNTSVEAFVAYSTGNLKWQVGPQVRYQLLSSFRSEYPVKENLFDFGLKVGVALNNK